MQRKTNNFTHKSHPDFFLDNLQLGLNPGILDSNDQSDLTLSGTNCDIIQSIDFNSENNFNKGLDVNSFSFDPTNFAHVEDILIPWENDPYPDYSNDTARDESIYLGYSNSINECPNNIIRFEDSQSIINSANEQFGADHSPCLNIELETNRVPIFSPNNPKNKSDGLLLIENCSPQDVGLTTSLNKSGRKPKPLRLTDEEKSILKNEGVIIPENVRTLTKTEERHIKQVKRRIKNKISAAESRKRKREYLDGLEDRVEQTTSLNYELQRRVCELEKKNNELILTMHKMRDYLGSYIPNINQTNTSLFIFIVAFALFSIPSWISLSYISVQQDMIRQRYIPVHSRTLLSIDYNEKDYKFIGYNNRFVPKDNISGSDINPNHISESDEMFNINGGKIIPSIAYKHIRDFSELAETHNTQIL